MRWEQKKKVPWPSLDHPCSLGPRGGLFEGFFRKRGWGNGCEQKEKVARAAQALFFLLAPFLGYSIGGQLWGNGVGAKKESALALPKTTPSPWDPLGDFWGAFAGRGGRKMDASKKKKSLGLPRHFFFVASVLFRGFCRREALAK